MSEYLDKAGLSYFWQKLKARFTNIENQLPSTITGVDVNTTTGAMVTRTQINWSWSGWKTIV